MDIMRHIYSNTTHILLRFFFFFGIFDLPSTARLLFPKFSRGLIWRFVLMPILFVHSKRTPYSCIVLCIHKYVRLNWIYGRNDRKLTEMNILLLVHHLCIWKLKEPLMICLDKNLWMFAWLITKGPIVRYSAFQKY